MKKILLFLTIVIVFAPLFVETNFAESSDIVIQKSYPRDIKINKSAGDNFFTKIFSTNKMPISNVGVKLYFGDSSNKKINTNDRKLQKTNRSHFYFLDPKGKKMKTKIYFSPTEKNYILATINIGSKSLKSDSKYKLVITKGLIAGSGETLANDAVIEFQTVNSDFNNKIYMALMALMFIGMFGFMAYKKRKDEKAGTATNSKVKEIKINPYEYAKKHKISIQEANKRIAKMKRKQEKQLSQIKEEEELPQTRGPVKRVKRIRSTKDLEN